MTVTLKHKFVKIRKPHKCWGCVREFQVGTKMEYAVYVDGNELIDAYWCAECLNILIDFEPDDQIGLGDLLELREIKEANKKILQTAKKSKL